MPRRRRMANDSKGLRLATVSHHSRLLYDPRLPHQPCKCPLLSVCCQVLIEQPRAGQFVLLLELSALHPSQSMLRFGELALQLENLLRLGPRLPATANARRCLFDTLAPYPFRKSIPSLDPPVISTITGCWELTAAHSLRQP